MWELPLQAAAHRPAACLPSAPHSRSAETKGGGGAWETPVPQDRQCHLRAVPAFSWLDTAWLTQGPGSSTPDSLCLLSSGPAAADDCARPGPWAWSCRLPEPHPPWHPVILGSQSSQVTPGHGHKEGRPAGTAREATA